MRTAWAEVVFPAVCPGCGGRGEPLCAACARTLRPAPRLAVPPGLDALAVPYAYTGAVRELVARAKYRHRHAALEWIGTAMADALGAPTAFDVVTWAPTTDRRRRERGFDQAEVLAAAVGRVLGRRPRPVLRRVGTEHQTGRSRAERIDAPVFVARARGRAPTGRVLVVDDVVTTGATLAAAAAVVRTLGASTVVGVAAARRP